MTQIKIQVLLLGADNRLAEAVSQAIRQDGGLVSYACTQADALRLLQEHPPDLVLLDLKSAEADCLNLLRQLKQHPPTQTLFTIGLAPAGDSTAILRAYDLGLHEFMPVPFEAVLFRARLRAGRQQKPDEGHGDLTCLITWRIY